MKETVGVVFGTFAPMHRGHVDLITRAERECDRVIVIVSGYEGDRGDVIGLPLQKRFRYIREVFNTDSLVSVYALDETDFPRYPQGWDAWMEAVYEIVGSLSRDQLVFYVSEAEYQTELERRNVHVRLSERHFNISATKIRQNPAAYWRFIAQPFRRHFTKKVLILGSASNGKTTLANHLGRFYDAPVSLEYARTYQQENNVRDDELTAKDYFYLLLGQYEQTSKLIDSKLNRGLVIADTDAVVTKAYYDYYVEDEANQEAVEQLYQAIVSKEKWDLILFVEPTGDYVDDGFRDMTMADNSIRQQFTDQLKNLLMQEFGSCPVVTIGGNYLKNYQEARQAIDAIYVEY